MKIQNSKLKIDIYKILRFIEVITIILGVLLVIIQIKDLRNANYGLTSLELMRDLYSNKTYQSNPKIIEIIHQDKPLLECNGGPISDEEINSFLGLMEWIDSAKDVGILNEKIIYEMFSVDILAAYRNKEIQEFINQSKADWNDNTFSSGFESLARKMEALELENKNKGR
jgi:hypothetical protein